MHSLIRRLELLFAVVIVMALLWLAKSWYDTYRFDHNPLPEEKRAMITLKQQQVKARIKERYGFDFEVPVVISDKMPSNLYGLAAYDGRSTIKIFLNKKRMKESMEYIIEDVIPHEYAHALMFRIGSDVSHSDGHSVEWQNVCRELGGSRCDRYVNHQDVVMGKLPF